MDSDEEFARKLQREFDEEAKEIEEREKIDSEMAQKLATSAHSISDSEQEEEEEEERGGSGSPSPIVSASPSPSKSHSKAHSPTLPPQPSTHAHTDTPKAKPVCQFGAACYRKNPWHLQEFWHPDGRGGGGGGAGGDKKEGEGERTKKKREGEKEKEGEKRKKKGEREEEEESPAKKKKKHIRPQAPFAERLLASQPCGVFLNKCFSLKETHDDSLGLVFNDLLSPALGTLVESAQFTFMADLDFLLTIYKAAKVADKPLLLVYGQMVGDKDDFPNLKCVKANIPYQYGTHHTKAMLLLYESGMRVVVHTANLLDNDWFEKTQGYWVSPLFPKLEQGKAGILEGDSPTRFKRDLVEYLQSYKNAEVTRWTGIVKGHDFSDCRAVLVGSVPGYHLGGQRDTWGHTKVRRLLAQHLPPPAPRHNDRPTVVIQCSSVGSLGSDVKSWLGSELHQSLSGTRTLTASPKICVVYPSEDDVRSSTEGWMGGSCLPYRSQTHNKQRWLTQYLRAWRSEGRRRSRSMPHIKTYTQLATDHKTTSYLMLTSANLSKAAWGCLQKDGTQLFIRSYELGVLLLPKFVTGGTEFKLSGSGDPDLTLPYDLPLTPYPPGALPWLADTDKKEKDVLGNTYP